MSIVTAFNVWIGWFSVSALCSFNLYQIFYKYNAFSKKSINILLEKAHIQAQESTKNHWVFSFFPGRESSLDLLTMICANIMQNKAFPPTHIP